MKKVNKILFIASIENHFLAFHIPFIEYLQNKGYELHVATKLGKRKKELEDKGIICHNIDFTRSINIFAAIKSLKQLINLMKKIKFSLVHVHTPMAAFLGRIGARITSTKPVLYTAHGFHFYKGAPWYYWLFIFPMEYLAGKITDGLLVINKEDYFNAQKLGFKAEENLYLVHGVGVDLDDIKRKSKSNSGIKSEFNIPKEGIIFSCIAGFTPNKNHIFLLNAWHKIVSKIANTYLLLIGDGVILDKIKKHVYAKKIQRVYFTGYRKDIPFLISHSEAIILVSKREGLPRSIMEAMAIGKPVIASNIRGNRDLVENNKNGLLIELGDIDGLSSSIEKLIIDKDKRIAMGKESIKMIQEYSIEKVLKEMSKIYDYYLQDKSIKKNR